MNFRNTVVAVVLGMLVAIRSFGLTNGPVQPEFSSFEPVDAIDLVNLPTGDFTYVLPLGNVNTPDGVGYPIVLSYHAGIQNDQEATWVGLGWSLNTGAINRQVRMLPDDYEGAAVVSYVYLAGEEGWTFDVGGGWGPIGVTAGFSGKSTGGVQFEGLTVKGGYSFGAVDVGLTASPQGVGLGASVGMGQANVGVGVFLSAKGEGSAYVSAGVNGVAGFSLASNGRANMSVLGQSLPNSMAMSQGGVNQWSSNSGITLPLPYNLRLDLGWGDWGWNYADLKDDASFGYLYQSRNLRKVVVAQNGLISYAAPAISDWSYGTVPPSGDPETLPIGDGKFEASNIGPFPLPAQDVYAVTGQGVAGQFMPMAYRATVACRSSDPDYEGIIGKPKGGLPFTYNAADLFNKADITISSDYATGMTFKMLDEMSLNAVDKMDDTYEYDGMESYDNIGGNGTGPTYIEGRRIVPLFDKSSALSGFLITDQEGKTYYYTYPLYSYEQTSYVTNAQKAPQLEQYSQLQFKKDLSFRRMTKPYATSWLLTAVTGPDYVKRLSSDNSQFLEKLLPQQGDWGYWVRFRYEYGLRVVDDMATHMPRTVTPSSGNDVEKQSLDKALFQWRMPYYDSQTPSPLPHLREECDHDNKRYSSSYGMRENTYLKSIETPSEVTYFRTSPRLDGFGIDAQSFPQIGGNPVGETPAPENLVLEKNNLRNLGSGGQDYKIVPRASDIGGENGDLEECTKITLPASKFPIQNLKDLQDGQLIATLKIETTVHLQKDYGFGDGWDRNRTQSASFFIVKDRYGCTPGSATETSTELPTKISSSFTGNYPAESDLVPLRNWKYGSYVPVCVENLGCSTPNLFPVGKCIYIKKVGDNVVLYVIGYDGGDYEDGWHEYPKSGLLFGAMDLIGIWNSYKYIRWEVNYWTDATYVGTGLVGKSLMTYSDPANLDRYVKKLDEVAWYSKAEYPFLDGATDPQSPSVKNDALWQTYPFPKSYRRVKFRYNYELADGTPNSKSRGVQVVNPDRGTPGAQQGREYALDRYVGGRLTLKEVYTQAGPEDAPVNLPSHMFSYQAKFARYNGHEDVDPWGFRKSPPTPPRTIDESGAVVTYAYNPKQVGVNWNLAEILLPTCGTISVDYERDRANSSWNMIAYMNSIDKCRGKMDLRSPDGPYLEMPQNASPDVQYYTPFKNVVDYEANSNEIHLNAADVTDLSTGMLVIVYFVGTDGTVEYQQSSIMYRIVQITNATVVLDRPLTLPSFPHNIRIRGINKKSDLCDGIRVRTLETRSLTGLNVTRYSYPADGIIETVPEAAIPKIFRDSADYELNKVAPVKVVSVVTKGVEDPNITYSPGVTRNDDGQFFRFAACDTRGKMGAWTTVIDAYVNNFASGHVQFGLNDLVEVPADLYILYMNPDPAGSVATRNVVVNGTNTHENVEFPSTEGLSGYCIGDAKIANLLLSGDATIKIEAVPGNSGTVRIIGVALKYVDNTTKFGVNLKIHRKITPMYSTGNTTVNYPIVEVRPSLIIGDGKPGEPKSDVEVQRQKKGFTRYYFHTFNDLVDVNGVSKPILSTEIVDATSPVGVKVLKVVDRTGIVGLARKIESVNRSPDGTERVVSETIKEYAFSDGLNASGIGVLSAPDTRLGADKPLGLTRERTIGMTTPGAKNPTFSVSTITDVVRAKPFLVSVSTKTDRVTKTVHYGLFDAYTGNAMATLTEDATKAVSRLDVSVPYRMLLNPADTKQKEVLDVMVEKNIYCLGGGSFVSNNSSNTGIPDDIAHITGAHKAGNNIKSASFAAYALTKFTAQDAPLAQSRLALGGQYVWKDVTGTDFLWPTTNTTRWMPTSRIDSVDRFSRPLTQVDAMTVPYSLIYHPSMNAVVGKIDNGRFEECAVYTCDYGSGPESETYFDETNDWVKGAVHTGGALELVASPVHFGRRSLHVKNSIGPRRDVAVLPNTDYTFSAWVYPTATTSYIRFAVGAYSNGSLAATIDKVKQGLSANTWQLVEFKIARSEIPALTKGFLRISIGCNATEPSFTGKAAPDFYVDDIRFYPFDALVSTYYYDHNLSLPITFVDANNTASYNKYDVFGRLVEKGIVKE